MQANHPDITITGMYNLLEKLRAGQPFTDADRAYNDRTLVATLKQILERLVALNAERAAEERNGLVRWYAAAFRGPGPAAPPL